jgi:thiol-disulfide isomerase/thioredoxin
MKILFWGLVSLGFIQYAMAQADKKDGGLAVSLTAETVKQGEELEKAPEPVITYDNAKPKAVNLDWIRDKLTNYNDTVYVVNFWATWCKPCLEEMTYFNEIHKMMENLPLKIYLVSNDTKKIFDTKLGAFVVEKNILPEVVWMSERNPNDFIDQIESEWTGAIPATLIVYPATGFRWFKEGEVTFEELLQQVQLGLLNKY